MNKEPIFQVKRLSKQYEKGQRYAVQKVSFELYEGEFLTIVGESGSGKTTLLKMLAGRLDMTQGQIMFEGELILGPSYQLMVGLKEVKLVNQDFELFPYHTVEEVLEYEIRLWDEKEKGKQIRRLLRMVGLYKDRKRKAITLSGGMQQRLAIARALVSEPKVILFDEPFSQLDAPRRLELRKLIKEVVLELETSVIFVTHDINDTLPLSDRIIVFKEGKIEQVDTPYEIYHTPKNEYVARLFDEGVYLEAKEAGEWLQKLGDEFVEIEQRNVFLRPEIISPSKKSSIKAKISKKEFYGSYYRYELDLCGKTLTMKCLYFIDEDEINIEIHRDKIIFI